MKLADFPEVRALSPQEKHQLGDELWLSVAPQLESRATSQGEKGTVGGPACGVSERSLTGADLGTISGADAEASSMNALNEIQPTRTCRAEYFLRWFNHERQ
jgi:hypothetical protein